MEAKFFGFPCRHFTMAVHAHISPDDNSLLFYSLHTSLLPTLCILPTEYYFSHFYSLQCAFLLIYSLYTSRGDLRTTNQCFV
jgi:hypothetical protein